jgi:hypothetical protein
LLNHVLARLFPRGLLGLALAVLGSQSAEVVAAEPVAWKLTIEAGEVSRSNLPIRVALDVPESLANGVVRVTLADGSQVDGQLLEPGLLSLAMPPAGPRGASPTGRRDDNPAATGPADSAPAPAGRVARELVVVLPKLPAEATAEVTVDVSPADEAGKPARLRWAAEPGAAALLVAGKPLLRYEMPAYDAGDEAARVASYKPFHHVFDPATGIRLTKGPGGQYTHHRGIFFGYNRITHGPDLGVKSDCWHCTGKARQEHRETLEQSAGPVAARQRVAIEWVGSDAGKVLDEVRELEIVPVPRGTVIDFASRLAAATPVALDGDPQHAGVHFRASNEVHEATKGETYYLRPDGPAEPGKFRNWPDDKTYVNAPWHAASFVVGGQRYTVLRVARPANPGEDRFSERDYARFGSYFAHKLEPEKPLEVGYRFWVQPGEMTVEQAARIAADYASPARVQAVRLEPVAR